VSCDPDLRPASIPHPVLDAVYRHALDSDPEECCGLLTGWPAAGPARRFAEAHPCRNEMDLRHQEDPVAWPRPAREAFYMNELDYLAVEREAERQGRVVTGVYHSHVDAGAYFSALDQEYARSPFFPFPDADHLVVAIGERRVLEVALFRWLAAEGRFRGRRVVPATP
jgi:proteasome lid subunit RPN8/RPN11